jgi:hypothetical protein
MSVNPPCSRTYPGFSSNGQWRYDTGTEKHGLSHQQQEGLPAHDRGSPVVSAADLSRPDKDQSLWLPFVRITLIMLTSRAILA